MMGFQDLPLGQYLPGSSLVHRLDPRIKLIACGVATAAAFLPGCRWGFLGTWPLLALGLAASGVPVGRFAKGLGRYAWVFAGVAVLHGFLDPSPAPDALRLAGPGLARGLCVSGQIATAIGFSALLSWTTAPLESVWALERMASPLKRVGAPVGEVCTTLLLAIAFFPILLQEAHRLGWGLRARGAGVGPAALGRRICRIPTLTAPLFALVFRRADALAMAMEARGYRPDAPRGSWVRGRIGWPEAAALGLAGFTFAAVALLPRLVAHP